DPSGFATRWSEAAAASYRAAGYWRDETLADVARRACREAPDRPLLIEGDRCLTRAEAWDAASRLAAFFMSHGLKPGDVVSFQLPNWIEAAVVALAARRCGLVLNPIPPIYRESELGYILQDCRARLVFVPQVFRKHDHQRMLEGLRSQLPSVQDVVVVRGDGAAGVEWRHAQSLAPARDDDLPAIDPAAAMVVMYTSGTTGRPKGVLHNHYAYDYRVRSMAEAWSIGPSDVVFMPSPVTHITGAYWVFDMPWVSGATSVLMDVWSADEAIHCIEHNRCTVTGGATPFLRQLLDTAARRPAPMAALLLLRRHDGCCGPDPRSCHDVSALPVLPGLRIHRDADDHPRDPRPGARGPRGRDRRRGRAANRGQDRRSVERRACCRRRGRRDPRSRAGADRWGPAS